MNVIKDGRYPIELDKQRHFLCSLNVIDEMQDRFGGLDKIDEAISGTKGIKELKWLLMILINEGAEEGEPALTEQQVGKLVHTGNLNEVKTAIFMTIALANRGTTEPPDDEEEDEDEDVLEGNVQEGGSKLT